MLRLQTEGDWWHQFAGRTGRAAVATTAVAIGYKKQHLDLLDFRRSHPSHSSAPLVNDSLPAHRRTCLCRHLPQSMQQSVRGCICGDVEGSFWFMLHLGVAQAFHVRVREDSTSILPALRRRDSFHHLNAAQRIRGNMNKAVCAAVHRMHDLH